MDFTIIKPQSIDVFHEVLFALSGTKSSFTSNEIAIKELFQLSEGVLLDRILNLGLQYRKLKKFIESVKERQFDENDQVGLYLLAFAEYLDRSLEPYWNDIVLLEQEIFTQPHYSLHFIWSRMHRHSELLFGLTSLVKAILSEGSCGCVILQYLHQILSSDVGVTRSAVALIIDGVNEIFFRQISCWLLYGDLVDRHHEFFVKENPKKAGEDDNAFNRYSLNFSMLPSHIDVTLAEKILNVGQTVLFLRSNPAISRAQSMVDERKEICIDKSGLFGEKEKKMQEKFAEIREVCKWNENGNMERLLAEMSQYTTLQLWTLAVEDAKLVQQLHLINDFFLLGRGELFYDFVKQAERYLSKPATGALDLNLMLQESARKILMAEEVLQRLSLELVSESLSEEGEEEDPVEGEWNKILMKYDAPWPLQLLFTPSALEAYNRVFRFLLRLKKIEVKLKDCWLINKSKSKKGIENLKLLQLHNNLCFILNNLQYYFHVDVLNSQFVLLLMEVETSKDFERIQKAHSVFLENLKSQLFLCADITGNKSKNPIKRSITKILELCEEYCYGVESHGDMDMREEKISCLMTRFEAFVVFLLNQLRRITSQTMYSGRQHFAQFLLRLDYNSYYSNQFSSILSSAYF